MMRGRGVLGAERGPEPPRTAEFVYNISAMGADTSTTQIYMPPREALRRLGNEGVVHGLDDAALDALRDECWDGSEEQLEEAGLVGILTFYYERVERGAKDGFVWHTAEFWKDGANAVAELSTAIGEPLPLFRELSA